MYLLFFVVGLLQSGFCSQIFVCKNQTEKYLLSNHHCHIQSASPVFTNPNQGNYHFQVDYAEPSDMKRFSLQPSGDGFVALEHILPPIFTAFADLEHLNVERSLDDLHSDDFAHAMNLLTMWLTGNKLKVIRNNVFSPVNKMILYLLHPTATLKADEEGIFSLHKLYDLLLARNEIAEIEDEAFSGLKSLLDLDLTHNRLAVIHRETFAGLLSLRTLILNDNKIETIEDGAFDLPRLMGLFLNKNKLKALSDVIFQGFRNIVAIKLDDNELESIGQSLDGIQTLQTISLKKNRIQDIDLTQFARLPHLIELTLTRSGFSLATTCIENGRGWNSTLSELAIDDNNLADENELEKLRIFPRLEVLNLDGNSFTEFEIRGNRTLKNFLPALSLLYLRETNIDCIDLASLAWELKAKNVDVVHDCIF